MNVVQTGINREIDGLGRIVIPVELRRTLNLNEGDALSIATSGSSIILTKFKPRNEVVDETVYGLKAILKNGELNPSAIESIEAAIKQLQD